MKIAGPAGPAGPYPKLPSISAQVVFNVGKADILFRGLKVSMLWAGKSFGGAQMMGVQRQYHATIKTKTMSRSAAVQHMSNVPPFAFCLVKIRKVGHADISLVNVFVNVCPAELHNLYLGKVLL